MKKIILILILSGIAQSQNFWEQTNGPLGGAAYSIAENSLGEILVGTGISESYIYRSPDGGETWIKSDSGMGYLEPEDILANSNGYLFTNGYGLGTYRSTTDGRTWEILPMLGSTPQTSCLYIKENDNVYVGISDYPPYRIVKSIDDGDTWIDISGNLDRQVEAITSLDDTLYIATLGLGFFKSTDDGETWIDLSAFNNSWITGLTKNAMGDLFASIESNGVLKSTDGGISWVDICPGIFRCHTILPDVMGYMYIAGKTEIKKSSDGGNSWVNVDNGIHSVSGESLYLAESGDLYFSTSDAGIFKSSDLGDSWKQVGFNNSSIYDITLDELDNIYVTTPNKIYKSSDFGNSYKFSGNGIVDATEIIHYTHNGYLWTGGSASSIYHLYFSSDKGENWNVVPGFEPVYGIDDNNFSDLFISASGGLYMSSDNGLTWILKHSGSYGAVFIDDNDAIYFGFHNLGLSTDNGDTWTTLLTNFSIDDIYVDKNENIFVGSHLYGLLRSTDRGTTWDTLNHNFAGERILAIAGNSTNQLFCSAGTYGQFEVYMSDDFGDSWSNITSGIPSNTICSSFDFDTEGFIYAGTVFHSVFRSLSTTLDINEGQSDPPLEYSLYQNYPNPFNPSSKIKFTVPSNIKGKMSNINLKVYDVLGKEVATLVNEELSPGEYEVEFNATRLSSGVYFYQLTTGDPETSSGQIKIRTKKMILIK
jgi:photosystem II stability/assembly factor-like uncharacterized protein